jgi:molecular chaperone DnaK (HSP70)
MKTTGRHFFGIDLGTSSCSIAYVTDDPRQRDAQTVTVRTVDVAADEEAGLTSRRIPSVVSAPPDPKSRGGVLFGDLFAGARRKKKDAPLQRRYRDYFSSVKSDLGTLRVYTRSRVAGCRTPAEVTAVILDRLRGIASDGNAALDLRRAPVVITVPASFSALARSETLDAAAKAGFDRARVRLLDEPVAALLDLLNGPEATDVLDAQSRNLLVFDYGAGTCDVALLRARFDPATATGVHVENLAISSYHRLGGDDIDAEVMREVVWPQICAPDERAALPAPRRREVEDTLTGSVARKLKEQMCRDVEKKTRGGAWDEIDATPVRVLVPVDAEFAIPELGRRTPRRFEMDSRQFAAVMAPFLSRPREADDPEKSILLPVEETLLRAGVKPAALHAVLLHGGSSLNPFVRRLMGDTFGRHDLFQDTRVLATPDPLVSVARGAALACYWRESRGVEIVRPIMPEDFGVVLRDGRQVALIAAGTPLPYPDAEGTAQVTDDGAPFTVPTDNAATLLVPFYTGTEALPRLAGTVKVPLPAEVKAGTPVRIAARVEADKTLRWWFRIGGGAAQPAPSVDDPWTSRALDAEERRLMAVRRTFRDAIAHGRPVTHKMLVEEANALRLTGRLEEALLAIEDALDEDPRDGNAHNVRGLVLGSLGRGEDAVQAYTEAMRHLPDNAVLAANAAIAMQPRGRTGYLASIGFLRIALQKDPTLAYAYVGLGTAYRATGDEPRALAEYRRALELLRREVEQRPFDRHAWMRLQGVYQALGEYRRADEARTVLDRIERDALYEGDSTHVIAGPVVRQPLAAEAE